MTIAELDKAIRPSMQGVYLFYGEEEYLKRRYREKIREVLVGDEGLAPFNHARLHSLEGLAGEVMTLPVMADRRLVEVEDVIFSKVKKEDLEALSVLAAEAAGGETVLLFYTRENEFLPGTAKKPSEAFRILGKNLCLVEFPRQTPAKLATWVARHVAAEGCFAPPNVCHALLERCGTDMNVLSGEAAKLAAYAQAHGETVLREDMIPLVVTAYRESGAFDFVNALLDRQLPRAFALFSEMKLRRQNPVEISASIQKVITDMMAIKALSDLGMKADEIAKELKMSEYPVKLRLNALRNLPPEAPERALRLCYETDRKLKSRSVDKYFLLEQLIIGIAS